jgi:hypothetical protein
MVSVKDYEQARPLRIQPGMPNRVMLCQLNYALRQMCG